MRPLRFAAGCVILLVCLVAAAWVATVSGAADARIVIVAGKPSHPPGMHEFRAGSLLLQKALAGVKGVTVDVYANGWPSKTVNGQTVDDSAALDGAAAVLIYADGGAGHPAIQRDHMAIVDALAAKGVGLGFGHYGVEVPAGATGEAMQRWIGGYYETNYSVNPMWAPAFNSFPRHPVTRGVAPFSNHDEWYFNMRWTPDQAARARMTPILTATPSDDVRKGPYVSPKGPYPHVIADSGKVETMMWVYERANGGRSFGFTGGHTHANWGDPNQRRVVLNALLWIARVEVPPGGVRDAITAADLTTNLDPKPQR
ncbi:MAG: ThuA domain-containing protein [Acidobacteria bacterium]|nr:ThuA domain-containing protein [Acidobacteriota bacterium]